MGIDWALAAAAALPIAVVGVLMVFFSWPAIPLRLRNQATVTGPLEELETVKRLFKPGSVKKMLC